LSIKANWLDKTIGFLSPALGNKRLKAKAAREFFNSSYKGASKARRNLSEWVTSSGDADADILDDLPTLRERSRDLVRNNSLATGALNTKVSHIISGGVKLRSCVDASILGISEEAANTLEAQIEREWKIFSENPDCDIERTNNFNSLLELSYRSSFENGDVFILLPSEPVESSPYALRMQLIESDRLCNAENASDTDKLSGGILKDKHGAPKEYHILNVHPGRNHFSDANNWQKVKAFGEKTGRRNILHFFQKKRIGQTRGVPDLAPVIEDLKQLGRYTDAVLTSAVISSFFTVFIKSEFGEGLDLMQPTSEIGGKSSDKDYKLSAGAILDLNPNEDVQFANPSQPNTTFDPFVLAMSRQIGAALELPYEILIKHFTASYSASRAAMLEAWLYFSNQRKRIVNDLCRPIFELFFEEAVVLGRIQAPGFISGDILIRQAYLGSEWIGAARGQIDEKKDIEAAKARIEAGVSTLAEETTALTGGDWEKNHKQRVKEVNKRRQDGLEEGIQSEPNEEMV